MYSHAGRGSECGTSCEHTPDTPPKAAAFSLGAGKWFQNEGTEQEKPFVTLAHTEDRFPATSL